MKGQSLAPGMQNRYESNLCAEIFRVGGKLFERFGGSLEQQAVNCRLIMHRNYIKLARQREDRVEICYRQKFRLARHDPYFFGQSLTFWAVPVAARVI